MIFNDVAHVVDDPQGQVRALWKQVLQERETRMSSGKMTGATVLSKVSMHRRSHLKSSQLTGE